MGDGGPPASNSNTTPKSTQSPQPSTSAENEQPRGTFEVHPDEEGEEGEACLLYTSPSPRDKRQSRMPSSA